MASDPQKSRVTGIARAQVPALILGILLISQFWTLANGIYGTLPFLMLFQVGFLYTGLLSVVQQFAGDGVVLKTQVSDSQ